MITYSLTLDAVDGQELVGVHNPESVYGCYEVTLVELHGPAGGNPIIKVTGAAPALLGFLLDHFVADNLDKALEFLNPNGPLADFNIVNVVE